MSSSPLFFNINNSLTDILLFKGQDISWGFSRQALDFTWTDSLVSVILGFGLFCKTSYIQSIQVEKRYLGENQISILSLWVWLTQKFTQLFKFSTSASLVKIPWGLKWIHVILIKKLKITKLHTNLHNLCQDYESLNLRFKYGKSPKRLLYKKNNGGYIRKCHIDHENNIYNACKWWSR